MTLLSFLWGQNRDPSKLYEPRHRPVIAIKCADLDYGIKLYQELEQNFAKVCPTEWLRPCIYMDIGQHVLTSSPLIDRMPDDYFDAVYTVEAIPPAGAPILDMPNPEANPDNVLNGGTAFMHRIINLHNPVNKDDVLANFSVEETTSPALHKAKFIRQAHRQNRELQRDHNSPRYYLGLYGGTGPLAGANVLKKMYADIQSKIPDPPTRQENISLAIYSNPAYSAPLGDKIARILNFSGRNMLNVFNRMKEFLKTPVDSFIITSNTMHTIFDRLQRYSDNKCANMISEVSHTISEQAMAQKIIVLGTDRTRQDQLYQNEFSDNSLEFVGLNDKEQAQLDNVIKLIKNNQISEGKNQLFVLLAQLRDNYNGHTFLLACTELPLAIDAAPTEASRYRFFDTSELLAKAVVRDKLAQLIERRPQPQLAD